MPENVKKGGIASRQTDERTSFFGFVKNHIFDLTAYAGLVVMLILFVAFNSSKLAYNFGSVIQAAAVYAIIALGAVFIYSMGFMDVSLGQQIGVYVILMILIGNKIGGVPGVVIGFLVVLALALACGAINGAVSIFLGLPSIVTSLFLMFFFTGAQYLLMEGTGENTIYLDVASSLRPADRNAYSLMLIGIIALLAVIGTYAFNYTKLGKYTRAIGANKVAAKQSGISLVKWQVMGYMALGFCAAIASFIMLTRTGSAGKGTGSGYAMDIMICLILGGMPLKGGMKSKISCALVGAFTYTLLGNVLTTMGVPLNWINFVKACIFLVIVLLTCRKPQGVLPR